MFKKLIDKLFIFKKKSLLGVILVLLIGSVGLTSCIEIDPTYYSKFETGALNFSQSINLTVGPQQGINYTKNLVAYWNMNEGSGTVLHDSSGNNNSGTVVGASWVDGKYGKALSFDGINSVVNFSAININCNSGAVSLWVNSMANYTGQYANQAQMIGHSGDQYKSYLGLSQAPASTYRLVGETDVNEEYFVNTAGIMTSGSWNNIVVNFINSTAIAYLNGKQVSETKGLTQNWTFDALGLITKNTAFSGILDEVQIYNQSLSINQVDSLYVMGELPNPVIFSNFYNFNDLVTNNSLLIYIKSVSTNNDTTLVTCTNFFSNNYLSFKANCSTIMTVWTNLGKPEYTTGLWNAQNYTTILPLDSSFIAELDWNRLPPYASNLSAAPAIAGSNTIFSVLWSDNWSLSNGGYIFSTNNTGGWVNSTWTAFNSNPCWGNETLVLNVNVGVTIGFREFANNSLGDWAGSGLYIIKTSTFSTPSPTPNVTTSPTRSTSVPTSQPSTPSPTPIQTLPPTLTPMSTKTNDSEVQTLLIIIVAIIILGIVIAYALKKGYLIIEVVDIEGSKEPSDNYTI